MNFEKLGIFIILIGMAIGGWAAYEYDDLKGRISRNSLDALMTIGTGRTLDLLEAEVRGKEMREDLKKLPPWMVGGGALFVLGFGMMYAGRSSAGSTRTCPRCAETIQAEAVICRYCRSTLPPADRDIQSNDDDSGDGKRQSYRAMAKAAERAERKQKHRQ